MSRLEWEEIWYDPEGGGDFRLNGLDPRVNFKLNVDTNGEDCWYNVCISTCCAEVPLGERFQADNIEQAKEKAIKVLQSWAGVISFILKEEIAKF